jgi:hypothetical protein
MERQALKAIVFSQHALGNLEDRGATQNEVEEAIRFGEQIPAKQGRIAFRKNFPFHAIWKGKLYETKQVMPIVVEEQDAWVVVTVYAFFIGGAG